MPFRTVSALVPFTLHEASSPTRLEMILALTPSPYGTAGCACFKVPEIPSLPAMGLVQRRTTACPGCSPGSPPMDRRDALPELGAGSIGAPCQRSATNTEKGANDSIWPD